MRAGVLRPRLFCHTSVVTMEIDNMTKSSLALSKHTAWAAFLQLSDSNAAISAYFAQNGEYAAEEAMDGMFSIMEYVWDAVPQTVQKHIVVFGRPHHDILAQFDFSARTVVLKGSVMAAARAVIEKNTPAIA